MKSTSFSTGDMTLIFMFSDQKRNPPVMVHAPPGESSLVAFRSHENATSRRIQCKRDTIDLVGDRDELIKHVVLIRTASDDHLDHAIQGRKAKGLLSKDEGQVDRVRGDGVPRTH